MKRKKRSLPVITYSLCLLAATAVISLVTTLPVSASNADDFVISETTEDYGVMPASDDPPTKEKK